ncbi:MAG: hypothetical protein K5683_03410, partial [Prevotella sp.]|nr:hypothetical protein [Prevotella sp.]
PPLRGGEGSAIRMRPCGVWTPEVATAPGTGKERKERIFGLFGFSDFFGIQRAPGAIDQGAHSDGLSAFRLSTFRGFSIHFRISPLPHLVLRKKKIFGLFGFSDFFRN